MASKESEFKNEDIIPSQEDFGKGYDSDRFDLPHAVDISIVVYDLLGREIARLVDRDMTAGYHQVMWNGRDRGRRDVPTGLYIARLVTPAYSKSIKMVLMK